MRFSILFAGSVLLLGGWSRPAPTVAQTFPLRYGFRAGGNISRGFGPDVSKSGLLPGYHAGVVLNLALTERLSVQPEALYTLKGDNSTAYGPSLQAKLTYLEVPLLARYTRSDVFVEAGPYAAYLLRHQLNAEAVVTGDRTYQNLDYGLALGFGYQDPGGMSVSWRYVAGLRDVYRSVDNAGTIEQPRIRNGSLEFTLGYWLPAWPWPFGGRGKDKD